MNESGGFIRSQPQNGSPWTADIDVIEETATMTWYVRNNIYSMTPSGCHDDSIATNTSNNTHTSSNGRHHTGTISASLHSPSLIFLCLLVVITCFANILVMVVTRRDRRLRSTVTNTYVFSLAAADLTVGLVVMSGMAGLTSRGSWPFGDTVCTMWVVLDFSCCSVSMLHLNLIAFDRFQATVHPIAYVKRRNSHIAKICITLAWVIGLLVWIPPIVYYRYVGQNLSEPTECFFQPNKMFVLIQAVCVYYCPIVAMVYFYIRVLIALHRRQLNKQAQTLSQNVQVNNKTIMTKQHSSAHCKNTDTDENSFKQDSGSIQNDVPSENIKRSQSDNGLVENIRTDTPFSSTLTLDVIQLSLRDNGLTGSTTTVSTEVSSVSQARTISSNLGDGLASPGNTNSSRLSTTVRESVNYTGTSPTPVVTSAALEKAKRQRAQHARIVRTLGIIILSFLLCWLPFCISWPVDTFCACVNVHFYESTYWLAYVNSALNPLLYFVCNADFRKAAVRLFRPEKSDNRSDTF